MKLLGLSAGRKMGNSEILLKEALMAAEEAGVEVELLRLHDLNIKPCTGCTACVQGKHGLIFGGSGECVIKNDDMPKFNEKLWESDGIIISMPVFIFQPPGYLKVLADRCGPSHDQAFVREATKIAGGKSEADPRVFKHRVGGFLSVGGAPHFDWHSLALPLMHTFTFPMEIKIVDMYGVKAAAIPGQVTFNDAALARARKLGVNVANAMGKPKESLKYMGDDPGTCPVCHCNAMLVGKESKVECAICGIKGELREKVGKITVTFSDEQQAISRLTLAGKTRHFYEIADVQREFDSRKAELPAKLEKYKDYKPAWK
jgi:multimeric flavodoxin WrbA